MTKFLRILISGLMIMFLSLSSLYGIEFRNWYTSNFGNSSKGYSYVIAFPKKGQTANKKVIFAVFSEIQTNNNEVEFILDLNVPEKMKLKTYSFYIGNENGNAVVSNVGKYTGKTDNGHYNIKLRIGKDLFSKISDNFIIVNINDNYYKLRGSLFDYPIIKYEQELEYERKQKEYQEAEYKRSPEYKQKIKKPIIDKLDKSLYDIKKDAFDGRIHITSKRMSSSFDNESIGFLRKNDLLVIPRLEVNSEYYTGSFGATFNIKYRSDGKGIGYMQAVAFSNGDKSTLIRIGRYGIGETGNSFADYGMVVSQVTVPLYATEALYTIFTEAGSKPILVRIYDGSSSSYDTQISEKEKQMFIDILKVKYALDNAE